MRILHLTKRYWPHRGGVERHVRDLASGLVADAGASVEVVVAGDGASHRTFADNGVRVTAVASYGSLWSLDLSPGYISAVGHALRRSPDVVHLHEPHPLGLVAWRYWQARRPMPPLVVTWHADILRQQLLRPLYGPVQERLLADAGAIIVPTDRHITSSAFLPAVASKCHVVPFGMDTAPYTHPSAGEAGRQSRASWGNPDRVVLFLGRLVYYKGVPVLLDAMARTDATLVIAGEGRDREALQDQAARLGIADRVRFIGDVPEADLPSVYHACDVFVLPSTAAAEGFGLVQLEAMACGKPVVSTTLPTGVAIVNRDGETGLTVPPGDAGALASAMTRLLDDRAFADACGTRARTRVQTHFSRESMVTATMALYRDMGRA